MNCTKTLHFIMGTITGALGEATNYFRPKSHETANPTEENEPNPRRVINQPDEESRVKDDNHEGHKDSFAISNVSSAAQEEEGNPISSEMNAPSRTRTVCHSTNITSEPN